MLSVWVMAACLAVCLAKTSMQGGLKPQMNRGMRSMYPPSMMRRLGNGMMGVNKPGKHLGGLQNGMGGGNKPGKAGLQPFGMQNLYGMGYPGNGGFPMGVAYPDRGNGFQRGISNGPYGLQTELGMSPQMPHRKQGKAGYQNGGIFPQNGMVPQGYSNGYGGNGGGYTGYPGVGVQNGYENGFGSPMYPGSFPRLQQGYGNSYPSAMADGGAFRGKVGKAMGAQPPLDMGAGLMRGMPDAGAAKYGNGGNPFAYLGAAGAQGAKNHKYSMNGFLGNGYRGGCPGGKCSGIGRK